MGAGGHSAAGGPAGPVLASWARRTRARILGPQLRLFNLPVSLLPHVCNWHSNPLQTGGCSWRGFNWAQALC